MTTSFYINSVEALSSTLICQPIIYKVNEDSAITGYAIPFETMAITRMKISTNVPILRVFTGSGTFTIEPDFSGGLYYIIASHDQSKNTKQLWSGTSANQNFKLTVDTAQQGLAAFALTLN